jgi:hypothetical protein
MVKLEHERDPSLGQSLDHPQLPQWTCAIQRLRGEACHQIGEDPLRAGSPCDLPVDVPANVEIGVVDPDRMIETDRHLDQSASEGG